MAEQINWKRFKYFLNPRGLGDMELDNAPGGWEDAQITFTRSQTYWGITRAFTETLKFVRIAALILRTEFWQRFLNANVLLTIQKLNQTLGYTQIYQGKIDFSKAQDNITNFTAPVIPNDFTKNIDAYDSVDYAISLNDPAAIQVELTPIPLNEIANLLPGAPPDGVLHSDYFPPITVVNNQQNSVNPSVQSVPYGQLRGPDFSTSANWFFKCRKAGKLLATVNLTVLIQSTLSHNINLKILDNTGATVVTLVDEPSFTGFEVRTISFQTTLNVTVNQRLYLYMQQVDAESGGTGITIEGGEIDLSYQTISPATMCKGFRAFDLFGKILQAMNINQDSGPNLPVPFTSTLLSNKLNQLFITSSDSIRNAEGSIYFAGDDLYPGAYTVLAGHITYGSLSLTVGDTFTFANDTASFSSSDGGTVQKTQSIFVGNVYNAGDTLQAGGTYLVGGTTGHAIYNGISYAIGTFFKFVLGQDSFTVSDDSIYVKQIAEDPQLIISFADFFQSIKSVMGGQACFGVQNGVCFLEDLSYVFRAGINNLSLGVVDKNVRFEPAVDLQCNSIKAGYEDKQYDAINGSQEVNSTQIYTSVLFQPDTQLNLVSKVRADPYGIETVRITQNDTAASRSDNDNFFVWIKDTPETTAGITYYHPLRTETLISIVGVNPDYYNWFLSPKQNLLRGDAYLASIFYGLKGYQLTLSSALKNSGMVTIDNTGRRVAEADPINISDLPDPLFAPIYASLQAGLPNDILGFLDGSPYADLNFDTQGINVKAFINQFNYQVGNEKPQDLKLLLTAKNNFLNFIDR